MDSEIKINGKFKFLPYNTGEAPLSMPEYGRGIQNLVDYCVMIPDREERTACACSIIEAMRTLVKKNSTEKIDDCKLWDHLNVMARFELDIDFPCAVKGPEEAEMHPRNIPYTTGGIHARHYGKYVEQMVKVIADMEQGEERDDMIEMIANQMKKQLYLCNPESADNGRVLHDLYRLSEGKIDLDSNTYFLRDFVEYDDPTKPKKKKKNKQTLL